MMQACGEQSFTAPQLVKTDQISSTITFNWDGKDYYGNDAEPGVYTYQITVVQQDRNPDPLYLQDPSKDMVVDDYASYRSDYLLLTRALDENGQLIYDVDYDGYDDKGTPEESANFGPIRTPISV